MEATTRAYFSSIYLDKLPKEAADYIKNEILTDPDLDLVSINEEEVVELHELITTKFPLALGNNGSESEKETISISAPINPTRGEALNVLEGIRSVIDILEGSEREEAEMVIEGIEAIVDTLPEKYKEGGELDSSITYTKGELIDFAYPVVKRNETAYNHSLEERSNIDAAIPYDVSQSLRELGLNHFWYVVNYNRKAFGELENLAEVIVHDHIQEYHSNRMSKGELAKEVMGGSNYDVSLPLDLTNELKELGLSNFYFVMDYTKGWAGELVNLAERWILEGHFEKHRQEKRQNKFRLANGGEINVDLFEHPEQMPSELKEITDRYYEEYGEDMDYEHTGNMLKEVEAIGYTFDYYLDNVPYGLRPIGVELNELKGYEEFANGGEVGVNTEVILTENRPNGAEWRGVVKPFMLKSIEENQYSGGFKRYSIDIYDEVEREPSKEEIKQANDFFDKVGGRFAKGGEVNNSLKAVIEFTLLDKNEADYDGFVIDFGSKKRFDGIELSMVKHIGDGSYNALVTSSNISLKEINGEELEEGIKEVLSEQFLKHTSYLIGNVYLAAKFAKGGKVEGYYFKSNEHGEQLFFDKKYQGVDITESTTNDYGYVVTVEPTSMFYQNFKPTTTITLEQAKKYVLKEISYQFAKGGKVGRPAKANKEYKFFVFDKSINKIVAGNEYKNDAKEVLSEIKEFFPEKDLIIYTDTFIKSKFNLDAYDFKNWKGDAYEYEEGGSVVD
jgi:hypothetical protein